jgi:SAM-dependent methyltransferase
MSVAEPYSRLAGVYDEIVVDPCYPLWAEFLLDLWDDDPDGVRTVLDVCCGTGLLTAELVTAGLDLVGVDASAEMLERARTLLGPQVPLSQQVLPALDVEGTFDAAISTFDGLNYLSLPDLRLTFEAIAARLRPGGWLVFDIHTDAMLAFILDNPVVSGEDEGYRFVITNSADPDTRVCDTTIDLTGTTAETSFTEHHRQYFHSDAQVTDALAAAGFWLAAVSHEYTRAPAGPDTLRATWIARLDRRP